MATVSHIFRSSRQSLSLLNNNKSAILSYIPARWLNLQEHHSKKLMADYGVTVQRFEVAETPEEAVQVGKDLKAEELVVKAQILAGGRGKGIFSSGLKGGVHLTKNPDDLGPLVEQMIGYKLKTKQTPGDGVVVKKVMVAQALDISRETYLAILLDRETMGPILVGSPEGGVDIEEVAEKSPELIFTESIDIKTGVQDDQAMKMAANLKFKGDLQRVAADQIKNLYQLFIGVDALQVEVNPFGETPEGTVVCFDAKISFDDNAKYRQEKIFAMDDKSEGDAREIEAERLDLNYIGMDGNIGCLVNGAGLAMATMDIIKLHGGEPANFLDVGGGVQEKQVLEAFKLISSDSKVKAILVNIFGGIVDCSIIANGITSACNQMDLKVPLIVRLAGLNVEKASKILKDSGLPITTASNLEEAAEKAVACLNR